MFFLLLMCLFSCHTSEDAEDFFDQKEKFENHWWDSDNFGVCLLVDSYEGMVIFDDGEDREFYSYEFEYPNIYYIKNYTVKVFPKEECYDIVIGLVHETVCECVL